MSSWAIYLKTTASLDKESFLKVLRCFLSQRGSPRQLRSDNGTNFVGAQRDLKEALGEMGQYCIRNELFKSQCDWIKFKVKVPAVRHMGRLWERQIRTLRAVLSSSRIVKDVDARDWSNCKQLSALPLTKSPINDEVERSPFSTKIFQAGWPVGSKTLKSRAKPRQQILDPLEKGIFS